MNPLVEVIGLHGDTLVDESGVEAEPISFKYAHLTYGLPVIDLNPLGADIRIRFVR